MYWGSQTIARVLWVNVFLVLSTIEFASAHGFGQRYDLPVPLWLYVLGAAAAVACSFVVIGLFFRGTSSTHAYPRVNLLRFSVGRFLAHSAVLFWLKFVSTVVFVLLIVAGLIGNQNPVKNLAPTLVWIIWWVGLAYISALGGNLWALINPWATLFGWAEALYQRFNPSGALFQPFSYPKKLGVWPAVLLFLAFSWVELVFPERAIPENLALLALGYSLITWAGMLWFGTEQWLRHGEAFSLVFSLLARFAPTEVRVSRSIVCTTCGLDCRDQDGECIDCSACFRQAAQSDREWNLRPFAVGLLRNEVISPSLMTFVLLLLSTVTFDGFMATPAWANIESTLYFTLSVLGEQRLLLIQTLGLVVFFGLFLGIYTLFGEMIAIAVGERRSGRELAQAFAFTLVPIALAYHLAHYLSFLLIQGQLIIRLLSDPFGFEWNLLGTAGYQINIGLIDARFVWFTAVIAIVLGHIIAVYLAHVIALRTFRDRSLALRSQYPLLVLMVGYTMISLWILAQPIVESGARPAAAPEPATVGMVRVPSDALLPELGTGVLRAVGEGKTAKTKVTYTVLTSLFHDGSEMAIADLLYPYIFAMQWSVHTLQNQTVYDSSVAKATALIRERLVGLRVVTVEEKMRGFGELQLMQETPVIEVYVNHGVVDSRHAAVIAPPWSSLPWHLMVLMEEGVKRGWAAFSSEEAKRRKIPWLDLVRDQAMKDQLVTLVEEFALQGYYPETLKGFVTEKEARKRWSALHSFYQHRGHFLVTNGPYILDKWSENATILQVFRDLNYPLGIGSFDRYPIPRKAYITQITLNSDRLEIYADVEKMEKFQRTYTIVREPLRSPSAADKNQKLLVCRYLVVNAAGKVLKADTAQYTGDGLFSIDLKDRFPPGLYTILTTLYLHENYLSPEVKMITYRVE